MGGNRAFVAALMFTALAVSTLGCTTPSSGGGHLWTLQFGTDADDAVRAVAIGPGGETVVFGTTGGALEGASSDGDDVFLRAYGP